MFSINDIINTTKGHLLSGSMNNKVKAISIDSRSIIKGSLFIPIKGKKYDGHIFIALALKKGAAASLTSKKTGQIKGKTIIYVKNTQKALHQIAKAYKERFIIPFIGITGSSGKTTTKDMLSSILSQAGKTLKSEENFNNEIGVPITLFKLNKKHKFCVIEMAMQAKGEIEELAEIVMPNISIITNIGDAHIGLLKSEKNIAKTKAEILKFHKKNNVSILPRDDRHYSFLKSKSKGRVLTFGLFKKSDITAGNISTNNHGISFDLIYKNKKICRIALPSHGMFNIFNALSAASAAIALKVQPVHIKKGLSKFKLSSKRMEITQTRKIRIINDSYNANPSSVKASLEMLREQLPIVKQNPPRRIAVLGDMLELGKFERGKHLSVGKTIHKFGIEKLITVGRLGKLIALGAKKADMKEVYSVGSNKKALKKLRSLIKPNDVILIKGSRDMKMEEIAEGLKKHV